MSPIRQRLSALALLLLGCGPRPVTLVRDVGPRLRQTREGLYVTGLPEGYKRGALLYVQAAQPVPGFTSRPHIAIVQGVDRQGELLKVIWYCLPKDTVIPIDGLPVEPLREDTEARLGCCWGRYLPAPDGAVWPAADPVELILNVGRGEDVVEKDVFEVLGAAQADEVNRVVTGYELLGRCIVQVGSVTIDRSRCHLYRFKWPRFDRSAWLSGGYVRNGTSQ